MSSLVDTTGESSVMFNLRQLMELESERELREAQAAECARLEAAEREQEARRSAEREARMRERQAAEAAQQLETEREVALLRVHLEAEAQQRADQARMEGLQSAEYQQLRRRVHLRRTGWAAALLLMAAGAGARLTQARREVETARASARSAAEFAVEQARELEALRARLVSTAATNATPAAAAASEQHVTAAPRKPVPRPGRAGHRVSPPHASHSDTRGSALDGVSDTNDPLDGL